jgi:hypothetical protein
MLSEKQIEALVDSCLEADEVGDELMQSVDVICYFGNDQQLLSCGLIRVAPGTFRSANPKGE